MNTFNFLSQEDIKEDLTGISTNHEITEEDNIDHSEVDDLYLDYDKASNEADEICELSCFVEKSSEEDATEHAAIYINMHIFGTKSSLALKGVKSEFSMLSPEDFSEEASLDARKLLITQSAEDFKEKAKAAVAKTVEIIKNIIKKILEVISRLLANTDKMKASAEAVLEKAETDYKEPEGETKVPTGLQVSGKYDLIAAITSFSKALPEVTNYIYAGSKDMKSLLSEISGSTEINMYVLGLSDGSKSKDAKILGNLGGNVDVGVGGTLLYTTNISSTDQKIKPLSKSEITAAMRAVIKDFDTINKLGELTKKVSDELNKNIDIFDKKITSNNDENLNNKIQKIFGTLSAKSGIKVISRMGTLSYMTSMDAIKVCEWSMSGKAEK